MLVLKSGLEDVNHGEIVILVVGIFVGILWLIVGYVVVGLQNLAVYPGGSLLSCFKSFPHNSYFF